MFHVSSALLRVLEENGVIRHLVLYVALQL